MAATLHIGPDSDTHLCLNCNTTVVGLEPYAEHCRSQHDNHLCLMCQHLVCGLDQYIKHKTHECHVIKDWRTDGSELGGSLSSKHMKTSHQEGEETKWSLHREVIMKVLQKALNTLASEGLNIAIGKSADTVTKETSQKRAVCGDNEHKDLAKSKSLSEVKLEEWSQDMEMCATEQLTNHNNDDNDGGHGSDDDDDDDDGNEAVDWTNVSSNLRMGEDKDDVSDASTVDYDQDNQATISEKNSHPHQLAKHIGMKQVTLGKRKQNLSKYLTECSLCQVKFTNKTQRLIHIKTKKHKKRTTRCQVDAILTHQVSLVDSCAFQCEACQFFCNRLEDFRRHIYSTGHSEQSLKYNLTYLCGSCSYMSQVLEEFISHYESHHKGHSKRNPNRIVVKRPVDTHRQYECPHCLVSLDTATGLQIHLTRKHGKYQHCKPCQFTTESWEQMEQHKASADHRKTTGKPDNAHRIKVNTKDDCPYVCVVCSARFKDEKRKQLHEIGHAIPLSEGEALKLDPYYGIDTKYHSFVDTLKLLNSVEKVACPETDCSRMLKPSYQYAHLRSHTGSEPFQCCFCEAKFSCPVALRRHLAFSHLDIRDVTCAECGATFHRTQHLNNHLVRVHSTGEGEATHVCDICGQTFTKKHLFDHHRRKHTAKLHVCSYEGCCYSSTNLKDVERHTTGTHTNLRPFPCDQCNYASKTEQYLKKHIAKMHTKRRDFKCNQCPFQSNEAAKLKRHLRTHSGEKPYTCPYCDYSCNCGDNLRKHIKTSSLHKGLPIFPCPYTDLCDFGTDHARIMRKHLVTVHSVNNKSLTNINTFLGLYHETDDITNMPIHSPYQDRTKPKAPLDDATIRVAVANKISQKLKPSHTTDTVMEVVVPGGSEVSLEVPPSVDAGLVSVPLGGGASHYEAVATSEEIYSPDM